MYIYIYIYFYKSHEGNSRRREEAPAAKALIFRFLRPLTVHRMPLAQKLNALFVSQWTFKSRKQNRRAAKQRLKN